MADAIKKLSNNVVKFPCCVCDDFGIKECLGRDCPAANGKMEQFKQALKRKIDREIPCKERRPIKRVGAFNIFKPNQ